jgi:Flp pilus assembly protein TadD
MRAGCLALLGILAGCAGGGAVAKGPGLDIGRVALASGSPDIALRISSDRLAAAPNNKAALLLQGDAYTMLGDTGPAEAAFLHVLALAPGSAEAQMGLGRLDLATNPAQSEVLFLQVLSEHPRDPVALNDLGIAQDLQGRHGAAQASYAKALGVSPNMQAPLTNLAMSLALSGKVPQAEDLLAPLARSGAASARAKSDYALLSAMERRQAFRPGSREEYKHRELPPLPSQIAP